MADSLSWDPKTFDISKMGGFSSYLPQSLSAFGIHRAILDGDLDQLKLWIEAGESLNDDQTHRCYFPLHVAVIKNDLGILEYLLSQPGINVDCRCIDARTPLNLSAALYRVEPMKMLLAAGADPNIPDKNSTFPLHFFANDFEACHLLVRHGAWVDAVDDWGRTVLHNSVTNACAYMMLYYSADANIADKYGITPFMIALNRRNVELQELLLDYVDDFNRAHSMYPSLASTLTLALWANSPFVKVIVERGAEVNYGDAPGYLGELSAFSACLSCPVDVSTFELIWEKFRFNPDKNTLDLLYFLNFEEAVSRFLPAMVESDNFEPVLRFFLNGGDYSQFVTAYAARSFDSDQLMALTCRLLQYGFRVDSDGIEAIFSSYGHCELFKVLLYMENDFTSGWSPDMALCKLIFDVNFNLEIIVDGIQEVPKEKLTQLLEYCVSPPLMDALSRLYSEDESMTAILSKLPRVPSLTELARNSARKHVWRSLNVATNCQFYTAIDRLMMPCLFKDILTFRRKLYAIRV